MAGGQSLGTDICSNPVPALRLGSGVLVVAYTSLGEPIKILDFLS